MAGLTLIVLNRLARGFEMLNQEQRVFFGKYQKERREFFEVTQEMFAVRNSSDWNLANSILKNEALSKEAKLVLFLEDVLQEKRSLMREKQASSLNNISQLRNVQMCLLIAVVVFLAVVSFFVLSGYLSPIVDEASKVTNLVDSLEGKLERSAQSNRDAAQLCL